jgi:hypothetical protein
LALTQVPYESGCRVNGYPNNEVPTAKCIGSPAKSTSAGTTQKTSADA